MLSYAHGACDQPLLGETIGHNLERTAARLPNADALISCRQGQRLTYAEFDHAVNRLASGILAAGIGKGDRVGEWGPNRAEWTLVQYATAKLGVILVNVNPSYRTTELEYVLGQSGCRWLVAARGVGQVDFVQMAAEARLSLPALERTIFFDTEDRDTLAMTSDSPDVRAIMAELDFDEPINIQYTSGTTGFPKGATLTHHNILNNAFFSGELLGYSEHDRICIPAPLYHCFGMVLGNLAATSHGACVVYPAETFDPEATLQACDQGAARASTGYRRCSSPSSGTSASASST